MRSGHDLIGLKPFNCIIVSVRTDKFDLQVSGCSLRSLPSSPGMAAKLGSTFDKDPQVDETPNASPSPSGIDRARL